MNLRRFALPAWAPWAAGAALALWLLPRTAGARVKLTSRAQAHAYYGPLRPGLDYIEGADGRIIPTAKWKRDHVAWFTLHDGRKREFNRKAGAHFVRTFREAVEASGYNPGSVQTTVYRHILWNPSQPLSEHSYGVAVDVNPTRNGYGKAPGRAEIDKFPKFVEVFERNGFVWGGRWKGKSRDPMHFELRAIV